MLTRLLKADLARGFAVSLSLTVLIALAAALVTAGTSLITGTVTSIGRLSAHARVPDLIQMHAGQADPGEIDTWAASRDDIVEHQVIKTLRVSKQTLTIAGTNQADSYTEAAFVTSPEHFDLLLGDGDAPVDPAPGEVALPVHYQAIGIAEVGDMVTVDTGDWSTSLRVVGFFRDAQMNAQMIPSKRLVVSTEDFAVMEDHLGDTEYLVEFILADASASDTVINDYRAAGLPSTGIAVTALQIRLINSLSTMLIAAVAVLVAILLVAVAVLALRYTVLASLEIDLPQIAVLRAIGAPPGRIGRLYLLKYLVLALAGGIAGCLAGYPLSSALGAPTRLYLGAPPATWESIAMPVVLTAGMVGVTVGFVALTLRRIGAVSVVEVLRRGAGDGMQSRRHWRLSRSRLLPVQQWLGLRAALRPTNALLLGVITLCTFTMALPTGVATTLDDPSLATYLGTGQADLRIDASTGSQDLSAAVSAVERTLTADSRVTKHTTIARRDYQMPASDGSWSSVLIDIGDHDAFPMSYISGRGPSTLEEISLSYSRAEESGVGVGDTVTVRSPAGDRSLKVTGIYQDITNNGLTAKALFDDDAPTLWMTIYADIDDSYVISAVAADLRASLPGVQVTGMNEYASQLFGATAAQVRTVAAMACTVALALTFLITTVFVVLVLAREESQVGILRALGSTRHDIAGQYVTRLGLLAAAGVGLGLLLSATMGERAIGLLLGTRGAPAVQLLPDPWLTWLIIPTMVLLTVAGAAGLTMHRLKTMTLAIID
ncbi:MAG: FtsX-like permease family protein [Propionibacteriaceae bacterium]|uniref:FtsX-like permease family n=1 Tax=Propionibacterium ruminifibrarum TaxID=1962131 RepID=A0A375I3Z9_9ACTN|nr:FtsX-like permease family protein [Propionibacterium ruminifibrarum]MBE6478361.1 FtsX-like permease family protein [Propionibacteriaceae bacterium]SPF68846.1 FtsX-like permease family [Propionibacterium ruminifibrarum]